MSAAVRLRPGSSSRITPSNALWPSEVLPGRRSRALGGRGMARRYARLPVVEAVQVGSVAAGECASAGVGDRDIGLDVGAGVAGEGEVRRDLHGVVVCWCGD